MSGILIEIGKYMGPGDIGFSESSYIGILGT
jgi:hypothetical protein